MSRASTRAPLQPVLGSSVQHQVAFVGPLGVGKTTAVRVGSTTPVSGSEVHSVLFDSAGGAGGAHEAPGPDGLPSPVKRTTTVGIEYGEWHREDEQPVAIYGTPGQARFSQARSGALSQRAAIVLWLFGQNDYALAEAEEWLDFIGRDVDWTRLTVAVTRLEEPGDHPSLAEYRPLLDRYHSDIPLVSADPRNADDVHTVLETALSTLGGTR